MLDVAEDGLHQDLAQAGPAVELMAETLARVAQDVETDNTPQLIIIIMKKHSVCTGFSTLFTATERSTALQCC